MTPLAPDPRPLIYKPNDKWDYRPATSAASDDGAPVDFAALFAAVWRRAWLVLGTMGIAVLAAWFWLHAQPAVYRARAVIQLVDVSRSLTGGLTEGREERGGSGASVLSEIEVIKSRAIAAEVADSEFVGQSSVSGVRSREHLVALILTRLTVVPRKQTNLIDLTFQAAEPQLATRVVNRVAQVYQAANMRAAQQQSRRRSEFIEQQLAQYDHQLAAAEHALSSFRTQQQAYTSADKFTAQQSGLAEYRLRERDLEAERQLTRELLRGLESGDRTRQAEALRMVPSSPGLGTNPTVARLSSKLGEYETTRAEQTTGAWASAPAHPEVRRLDTLIAATEQQLTGAVRAHVALLDARVESLNDLITKSSSALRQLPSAEAAETRLVQNAEALRQQTAVLRTELQQAQISQAASVGQVEIIDLAMRATVNSIATTPVVLFAVMFGLALGGSGAVLLEKLDKTIKRRDEVESVLQLPVLATIPRISARVSTTTRRQVPSSTGEGALKRAPKAVQREKTIDGAVIEEAFRQLRTGLLYASAGGRSLQRVLVTSPVQGDGKTSVSANLGMVLAQQGIRVAIIDCDLHAPHLHRAFQLPVSPGLGEILSGQGNCGEHLHVTGVPRLSVLTAGVASGPPSDVVGGNRMQEVLNELSQQFDMLILDTAPVLAVSDSVVLSTSVDAVLLVVRAGHTTPVEAGESMRYLSAVGARLAGVVLNDPEERTRKYGGYYRGSERYART